MKERLIHCGTYRIFGAPTELLCDCSNTANRLKEELALYPESNEAATCTIRVWRELPKSPVGANNPKIHRSFEDGFLMKGRMSQSLWKWRGAKSEIDLSIQSLGAFSSVLYRFAHRQNTTREEMLGQILHEGVLIPRLLTSESHALLHASAIATPSGSTMIAIGGTGGSGKTSLMLHACLQEQWCFAADDITVLTTDGDVWPNYAYPKIYGYNVDAFPAIADKLFDSQRPLDRLHWKVHKLRGLDKVRRRIAPDTLFKTSSGEGSPRLSDYVILHRQDRPNFELSEISIERAADASTRVIATEYTEYLNHWHWHRFNREMATGVSAPATDPGSIEGWTRRTKQALAGTRCWRLAFPEKLNHRDFLQTAWPLIQGLGSDA